MDKDTRMGGPDARFPETRASALRDAACPDDAIQRVAHEHLVAAYWKPVYKYIRLRWRASNDDAKDLTQAFFAKALVTGFFAAYDAEKAAFRTFLRLCVDRFVSNQRSRRALATAELTEESATVSFDAEACFHREWVRQMFALSVDALRTEYANRGRHDALRAFEMYDLCEEDRPSYADVAKALDVPVTQVTNFLAAVRRDLRRIVLAQARLLTATEREYRAEARALLGRPL